MYLMLSAPKMTRFTFVVWAPWLCCVFAQCCLSPQGRLSGFHFFYTVLVSSPLIFCLIFPCTSFRAKSFYRSPLLTDLIRNHRIAPHRLFFLCYMPGEGLINICTTSVAMKRNGLQNTHLAESVFLFVCLLVCFFKPESTEQTHHQTDNSLPRNITAQQDGSIGMSTKGRVLRMSWKWHHHNEWLRMTITFRQFRCHF